VAILDRVDDWSASSYHISCICEAFAFVRHHKGPPEADDEASSSEKYPEIEYNVAYLAVWDRYLWLPKRGDLVGSSPELTVYGALVV